LFLVSVSKNYSDFSKISIMTPVSCPHKLSKYAFVLEMLLRIRQVCDHIALVPEKYHQGFAKLAAEKFEQLKRLVSVLEQSAGEECCICLCETNDPVVTPCAHCFCRACIDAVITKDKPSCPLCRAPVTQEQLIDLSARETVEREEKLGRGDLPRSTKLRAVLEELRAIERKEPGRERF